MNFFTSISILFALLLAGCNEYSQAKKAVQQSVFFRENLDLVIEYNKKNAFLNSQELWIGKVKKHDARELTFSAVDCIESPRRGLLRRKCSLTDFRWDETAYPFFNEGDIVLFVINHNMKNAHSILIDRMAKIDKMDDTWQVVPQKIKQYSKTYYAQNCPFMVYAAMEKSQFIPDEKIILNITIQNVQQNHFFIILDNPVNELHLKIMDVDTGNNVKRIITKEDMICRQVAPVKLEYEQKVMYAINLSEAFSLDKLGNYSVSLSGSVNCELPSFELKNIDFEIRTFKNAILSEERIIEIAKKAIAGKISYDINGEIIVETTEAEEITPPRFISTGKPCKLTNCWPEHKIMIKILAYFTLTLFVLVIPVTVCLLHTRKPQWFAKWKKLLWLLGAMLFSYVFVNATILIPYYFGFTQIRDSEAAFAIIFGWLYLPITSIPVMLVYFTLLSTMGKISKPMILCVYALFILFVTAMASGYVYHRRPLYRSNAAEGYELRGGYKVYATVYRRLGFLDEYWLKMDGQWFVWTPANGLVGIPNVPRNAPYLYVNHDTRLGVDIDFPAKTDGKYLSKSEKSIAWEIHDRTYHVALK